MRVLKPSNILWVLGISIVLYLGSFAAPIAKPDEDTILLLVAWLLALTFLWFILSVGCSNDIGRTLNIDPPRRVTLVMTHLLIWLGIGCLALEHTVFYLKFGQVPILHADFEILRSQFAINGYIHLLAFLPAPLFIWMFWYSAKERLSPRSRAIVYISAVIFFILSATVGSRGLILQLIIFFLSVRSFERRINIFKLAAIGCVALYSLGAFKLFRELSLNGPIVYASIDRNWPLGSDWLAAPLYYSYLTLTYNFHILNLYVVTLVEFTLGYFTLYSPIASVITDSLVELRDFQNQRLGLEFRGTLTATGIGVPFIDFGFFGIGITLVWWWLLLVLWRLINVHNDGRFVPMYIYIYYQVVLYIYTYTFNKFYVLLSVALLFALCISQKRGTQGFVKMDSR